MVVPAAAGGEGGGGGRGGDSYLRETSEKPRETSEKKPRERETIEKLATPWWWGWRLGRTETPAGPEARAWW